MQQNNTPEPFLSHRQLLPHSARFPERIVQAARVVPQRPVHGFGLWVQAALGDFMLPHPAFSLGAALTLGLLIGFSIPAQTQANSPYMPLVPTLADDGVAP